RSGSIPTATTCIGTGSRSNSLCSPHLTLSSPAKAGDPVFQRRQRMRRSRGVLDSRLSRGMTAENGQR
ncbi:hypothetical protein ACJEKV_25635, partial [Escherichia coli]